MRVLSTVCSVLIFAFSSAHAANKEAEAQASKALEDWAPVSVKLNDTGQLKVVLPQRSITETIFKASVLYGFCGVGVAGFGYDYPDVVEVAILNQFEAQGYVWEGTAADCKTLNELSGRAQEIELIGNTRLY